MTIGLPKVPSLLLCLFCVSFAPMVARSANYSLVPIASFDGANGSNPFSYLTFDSQGNLYGTSFSGGSADNGTLYEISASNRQLSTLATFDASNGSNPVAGLVSDSFGNLYGATIENGGVGNHGTLFKISAGTHQFFTLATFNGTNGSSPVGDLMVDANGNIFGTAHEDGPGSRGTIFEFVAATQQLVTLASFENSDGSGPIGQLSVDASGNLFGTTIQGGASNRGTVFELPANANTITTLAVFNGTNGAQPYSGILVDSTGNLYGTTSDLQSGGFGTVFKIAADTHQLMTISSFDGNNGKNPTSTLLMGSDGNFIGTTQNGGDHGLGTVFQVDPSTGAITTLYSFNGADGANPFSGLIKDSNGNLYGTTMNGGANDLGTVYELKVVPEVSSVMFVALGFVIIAGSGLYRARRPTCSSHR